MPPYTTRSSGRSATSGSRLFISMRSGASVSQLLALSCVPRGARTVRAVIGQAPGNWGPSLFLRDSFPYLPRRIHHDLQLAPLLFLRKQIAGDARSEAALRAERELVERNEARGVADAPDELVRGLDVAGFRSDQPDNHRDPSRNKPQRLEAARARSVVFQEQAVKAQAVE